MLTATPAKPNSWVGRATKPVSAASTAVFRIAFGLLVTFSTVRFLTNGWVEELYLSPANHLTYPGFGWIQPLSSAFMYGHLVALACAGIAIAVGYRHRLAAAFFVIGFAYIELIDAALYLNHYWFMTLAGGLLLVLPVHHHWSVDARAGRTDAADTVPAWVVWALRSQVGAVYVFAGVAKLNGDWLLRAQPLDLWFADRADTLLVGPLLGLSGTAFIASWVAALFDCTIGGWLLWPRTRRLAYAVLVIFHVATWSLFQIGVFPWVMICCATVFFPPGWPQRFVRRSRATPNQRSAAPRVHPATLMLLAGFAIAQIALPLRHYAYDGNVRWTEEGYHLSWRVMLTEKAGFVDYYLTDPATGETTAVDARLVLTDWQAAHAATRPDMIHATALLLEEQLAEAGQDLEVRADAFVAMNSRAATRLLDPTIDLTAFDRGDLPPGTILSP